MTLISRPSSSGTWGRVERLGLLSPNRSFNRDPRGVWIEMRISTEQFTGMGKPVFNLIFYGSVQGYGDATNGAQPLCYPRNLSVFWGA